jgi:hypothetical protein
LSGYSQPEFLTGNATFAHPDGMGAFDILSLVIRDAVVGWLALVAFLFVYRCLNGGINTFGLLARSDAQAAEGRPSPERVQLLLAFLIAVAGYVRIAIRAAQGATAPHALPDAPAELVALFIASHAIYLGGKLGWLFNLKQFIAKPGD